MPRKRTSTRKKASRVSKKTTVTRRNLPDPGFEMMALAALVLGIVGLVLVVVLASSYFGYITA